MTAAAAPPLRVLIVEDEPLARRRLRLMLAAHADAVVVGEAEDVRSAIRAARTLTPDVLLLDVRIPGGDGFDVARRLLDEALEGRAHAPFIIFVTADPTAAVPAFDVQAVDFLLKPYDAARLGRALDRAREAARRVGRSAVAASAATGETVDGVTPPAPRPWRERFVVIRGRRRVLVPVSGVQWIEADDNYVVLHVDGARMLVRHSLRALEQELDPAVWLRVHRSAMIRRDQLREVITQPDGELVVRLRDGSEVRVGATYRKRLRVR